MKIVGLPRKWKDVSKKMSDKKQIEFLFESFTLMKASPMRLLAFWMGAVVLGMAFFSTWQGKIWLLLLAAHIIHRLVSYIILFDEFRRKWK